MNNKFYGENQDCPLDLNHKPDKTPFKTLIIFSKPIINNFICMILLYTHIGPEVNFTPKKFSSHQTAIFRLLTSWEHEQVKLIIFLGMDPSVMK